MRFFASSKLHHLPIRKGINLGLFIYLGNHALSVMPDSRFLGNDPSGIHVCCFEETAGVTNAR